MFGVDVRRCSPEMIASYVFSYSITHSLMFYEMVAYLTLALIFARVGSYGQCRLVLRTGPIPGKVCLHKLLHTL